MEGTLLQLKIYQGKVHVANEFTISQEIFKQFFLLRFFVKFLSCVIIIPQLVSIFFTGGVV